MSLVMVRNLYEYHRWANRRLFDVADALGEDACARDMGKQWSVPTLTRMFGHLYGADLNSLKIWKGSSPTESIFFELGSMAEVRRRWDPLEAEQKAFVESLTDADLSRVIDYKTTQVRLSASRWASGC